MKLWTFKTYDQYLSAQIKGTDRRKRRNQRGGTTPEEVGLIFDYTKRMGLVSDSIVCHGAGNGKEVDLFKAGFPDASKVIGTDLVLWGKDVVQWDFNKPNPKWEGMFDVIYTNSMDHSPDPIDTIQIWLNQLSKNGLIFLQWNTQHSVIAKADTMFIGGDCFAAFLDEFIQTFETKSQVVDLIYCGKSKRRGSIKVLVVVKGVLI